MIICEWFAKCWNPARVAISHPVLGWVPACDRCIDKFNLLKDHDMKVIHDDNA